MKPCLSCIDMVILDLIGFDGFACKCIGVFSEMSNFPERALVYQREHLCLDDYKVLIVVVICQRANEKKPNASAPVWDLQYLVSLVYRSRL